MSMYDSSTKYRSTIQCFKPDNAMQYNAKYCFIFTLWKTTMSGALINTIVCFYHYTVGYGNCIVMFFILKKVYKHKAELR